MIVTGGAEAAPAAATSSSTSSSAPPPPQQPPSASLPLDEVDRILRVQHNAYAILKLDRHAKVNKSLKAFLYSFRRENGSEEELTSSFPSRLPPFPPSSIQKKPTPDDIKKSHRALSRLVHPDKNPGNPRAAAASAALNAASDILSDPVKRKIFDLYVQDTEASSSSGGDAAAEGGGGGGTNKSFADWEAEAMRPPRWLLRVLGCPGGGVLVAVLALLLLVPAVVLLLAVALLCLPLRLVLWHCCGVGEPVFVRRSRERDGEERGGGGGGGGGGDVELGQTAK